MTEHREYRGWIAERDLGEAMDVLFLSEVDDPLAEAIEDDIDSYGRYLSVRYFISDVELERDALINALVRTLAGAGEAEFHSHYSEITGYLWTDENIMVGGHDLLEELRQHKGSFCHLEIDYAREPRGES